VLDALGGGQFFVGEGADSFLELHDAVLQNGDTATGADGGAILANNGANVEIHTSSFISNEADIAGGAIYAYQGTVEIYDSTFESNIANEGYWFAELFLLMMVSMLRSMTAPSRVTLESEVALSVLTLPTWRSMAACLKATKLVGAELFMPRAPM
jgi:hypothetical protein